MRELENVKMEMEILNHVRDWMNTMSFSTIEELEIWLIQSKNYLEKHTNTKLQISE
jgi:hypothetical protein